MKFFAVEEPIAAETPASPALVASLTAAIWALIVAVLSALTITSRALARSLAST